MFRTELKSKIGEDISILVQLDNHAWNYICECGDASGLTVKEIQNTNAIFISHTHIDHFINFDTILRHQIGLQRRIVICGPKGIAQQVQSRIKGYSWNLIQKGSIVYEIRELVSAKETKVYEIEPPIWELKELKTIEGNQIFEEKSFAVTAILLDHKIPTLAYKFKEKDTIKIDIKSSGHKGGKWVQELKFAFENGNENKIISIEGEDYKALALFDAIYVQEGDSVGVIMDHAASESNHSKIIKQFKNCKKVWIESFYKKEDKELATANYHSYAAMSAKVMRLAGVGEAIPVHFSRKYNENDIKELIKEFEEVLYL